jgi:hypothetical protein
MWSSLILQCNTNLKLWAYCSCAIIKKIKTLHVPTWAYILEIAPPPGHDHVARKEICKREREKEGTCEEKRKGTTYKRIMNN